MAVIKKELSPEQVKRVESDHAKIHAEMERGETDPIKAYQLGFTTGVEIGMKMMDEANKALRELKNEPKDE